MSQSSPEGLILGPGSKLISFNMKIKEEKPKELKAIAYQSFRPQKKGKYLGVLCINNYKPRQRMFTIINLPVGYMPTVKGRRGKLSNWVGVWKVKYHKTKKYRKDV